LTILNYTITSNHIHLPNIQRLCELLSLTNEHEVRQQRADWVDTALKESNLQKNKKWTKSLAVGGLQFTESFVASLGLKGQQRKLKIQDDSCIVKEPKIAYI